ncbi:MAG: ribbon-helix-helix protein, CopG family [Chloroflexi bacterium]|nr:ribbon-helix-helix protein, CopG family [Chloroflexota bacterium]
MSEKAIVKEIRIPVADWKALEARSADTHVPTEELIREALRRFLAEQDRITRARRALRKSSGIWRDRDDLQQTSVELVNSLREEWDERAQ